MKRTYALLYIEEYWAVIYQDEGDSAWYVEFSGFTMKEHAEVFIAGLEKTNV